MDRIYKICPFALWQDAVRDGVFRGSADDKRDGYIHFSTAEQVVETAKKHFAGQDNLLLIQVAAATLGDKLKWEVSRGSQKFPHLYGELDPRDVLRIDQLTLMQDGRHKFPPLSTRAAP